MTYLTPSVRLWTFILLAALAPVSAMAAPFAAYVIDARNGQPIYKQNEHTKLHPASLTKMMTLYLAFTAVERGQVRLDSKFTVSSNAAAEPPSKLGLRAGQQIELRYLLRAAAIKSANDAATTIAEGLGGSEAGFAQQMTAMARALGMRDSQFQNAHGLTQQGHYSSAYDMTLLGRRLFNDFPQYYNLFSRRSADAGISNVSSTNKRFLDEYAGADGIKTGYTRAAGFNLTASAQRGQKRLVGTVFGGTSTAQRNQVMAQLLDSSFSRVPERVRVVGLPPAPALQTRVVRQAQVAPTAAVTQARPESLVLNASAAPVGRSAVQSASLLAAAPANAAPAQQAAAAPAVRSVGQLTASARPAARPGSASAADPTAEAVAQAVAEQAAPTPEAPVSNASVGSSTRPVPAPRTRETASAAVPAATPAAEPREEASANSTVANLEASKAPKPRSETVILAAMGEGDTSEPAALEIVSRQKNSGRSFGVSLGMFNSEAAASAFLMETALRGGSSLADSVRRVSDTSRGFQAHLDNLTKEQAQLTCDRLISMQESCEVVGR